ncbi:MAG: hypothetical protein A2589_02395 [Candidatus Vogelbacteria bacterium RIFOXYD1_FULL_46_19]|uniref:Uncharacterized protein n=1 Tax=Candidatus Vogelbacteria bacterium RIFOXYD1_FULL_46_19 TaxID=1802439 RepID=A0A1G2QH44_9BACT|nr:MAG: hypothetical protein A2589_02395 [Candidatus Vogelbacteria bacterium RIFOXYD1_FULL_46_19]
MNSIVRKQSASKKFLKGVLEASAGVGIILLMTAVLGWFVVSAMDQPVVYRTHPDGEVQRVLVVEDGEEREYGPEWLEANPGSYQEVWVAPAHLRADVE